MKKIAVIISHPIQHFCPQYANWAKAGNFKMKVFFGSSLGYKAYYDSNFKKEISWDNLGIDKFDHVFLNGDKVLPSDSKLDAQSLENELSAFQPDVIISYGYFQPLQRRATKWAIKNKVKIAYVSDSELRQKRNKWKQLLKYPYLRKYFTRIDFFLSVGDANETFYKYYGVKSAKIIRMHFPIDLHAYSVAYANKDILNKKIREQYNIHEDAILISVVGKLVEWKNQDHIIEAMSLLENQGIITHLLIIGSGDKMEEWKMKAMSLKKSKVHFAGFISVNELPGFYAASDIYVHPASQEPHSIAVSEAIYMGCPVIMSDRCGSYGENDDVQIEKNGFIYSFGNIEELAFKIKYLINNPELLKSFSNHSHNIALEFQDRSHKLSAIELISRLN